MNNSTILQNQVVYFKNEHSDDIGIGQNPVNYMHYHDMYEINLVLSGEEELSFSNEQIKIKERELCIFRPYEIHKRTIADNSNTSQICLSVKKECFEHAVYFLSNSVDTTSIFDLNTPFIKKVHSADMNVLYTHINNLYDPFNPSGKNENVSETELKIVVINILAICLKADNHTNYSIPMWLQQLNIDMSQLENCSEGIKALSRLSGKSNSTISHAFKQYYNMTPSKFVNDKRLQNATSLLENTDKDITEIAYLCGFGSLSYFYKLFNDVYNTSPLQYRNVIDKKS